MRFVQLSPLPLAILILAGSTMRLGAECGLIPYTPTRAQNSAAESAAREHLKKSIGHYEAALAIDRGNLLARLGYGWVLDQAGEKTRAIVEYRQVIKDAWSRDERTQSLGVGDRFFTEETAGYLIPLLDPNRDAAEIADLQAKLDVLAQKPRAITPLAIPLSDQARRDAIVRLANGTTRPSYDVMLRVVDDVRTLTKAERHQAFRTSRRSRR